MSWDGGKPKLDTYTMEATGVKPVPLRSNSVWIRVEQMCLLLTRGVGEF